MKFAMTAALAAMLLATPALAKDRWTPAWTASMWQATGKQKLVVENATVSFAVRVGADGDRIRLRLSNEYGAPFHIGAASVRIDGGMVQRVTFNGQATVDVAGKGMLATDPIKLRVKQFDVIHVALYLPGRTELSSVHGAGGDRTLISAAGDQTAVPFEPASRTDFRPFLASVEVAARKPRPVVVAFGDSITDNTGCNLRAVPICRWGDVLGRRLAAAGKPHVVVTQAISGNRVLPSGGSGPAAIVRFDRDVLQLPGVTHVILLEGINDIGGSGRVYPDGRKDPILTAEQLIEGYRSLITRARARKIKVMALTILPFEGAGYQTAENEQIRVKVNDWIRTSGAFDKVFDMEKVMADPTNPKKLNPAYQRGDNLHPDARGETKMGESIPLGWF